MRGIWYTLNLLLATIFVSGCKPTGSAPPSGSPTSSNISEAQPSATEWKVYSHPVGKYSVLMPGNPKESVQDVQHEAGMLKFSAAELQTENPPRKFFVAFTDYPPGPDYEEAEYAQNALNIVVEAMARSLKGSVQDKNNIKLGEHPGLECVIAGGTKARFRVRVFFVRNRLYQITATILADSGTSTSDDRRFMDSFKVDE